MLKKHPAIAALGEYRGKYGRAKVRIVSKTALTPAARMCCELHQRAHAGPSELASACFVCVVLPCIVCGWWNEFPHSLLHCLRQTPTSLKPRSIWFWVETISRLAGSYWCRRHHPAALLAVHWGRVLAACLYCGAWCDVAPPPVTKHVFAKGPACVLCGCQPQYGAAQSPW